MKWQELNKQQERIQVEEHLESILLINKRKKLKQPQLVELRSLIDLDLER